MTRLKSIEQDDNNVWDYNSGMEETLNNPGNYQEYRNIGGEFSEEDYLEALSILSNKEEKPGTVARASLNQAESMARFANLPVTTEQRYLYAVLRERPLREVKKEVIPGEIIPVESLSDQRILAEVFLLTGDLVNYEYFKSSYPNIFG